MADVDTTTLAPEATAPSSAAAPAAGAPAAAAAAGPKFSHVAELKSHNDWVTCLQVAANKDESILVSGSRDKTLLKWKVEGVVEGKYATPIRRLGGHNHFISDVALADEGKYAISSSWDGTLRLWDLSTGESVQTFKGHSGSVLSVSVSPEKAHIVSGGRDRTIKFWNIRGRCIFTTTDKAHTDWVSCVRFAPRLKQTFFISASWDKLVKVWGYAPRVALQTNFIGHTGFINVVTVSPDGSLCASGGKDGTALLWDLRNRRLLTRLQAGDVINALAFSPMRYWLAVATPSAVMVWDLRRKTIFGELNVDRSTGDEASAASKLRKGARNQCISLTWSSDGAGLYCGCTDGSIHVFHASLA